jgi:hypothetical protein
MTRLISMVQYSTYLDGSVNRYLGRLDLLHGYIH